MKTYLLFGFIVLGTAILQAACSSPDEVYGESGNEIIYRVTRGVRERKKSGECRYKKGMWDDCDAATNTERRVLTLKKGDTSCDQTKVLTRKCKKACKYEKGDWSDCDISTNTRTRTDTLKPKSDSSCPPTKSVSKKCKKVCRYSKQASWSECDAATGKKTKLLLLSSGDPQLCGPNKTISKNCGGGRGGRKTGKGKQMDEDDDYDDEE